MKTMLASLGIMIVIMLALALPIIKVVKSWPMVKREVKALRKTR